MAMVLMSKYFPYKDVMQAKKRQRPNYTWASICDAKRIMEEGTM